MKSYTFLGLSAAIAVLLLSISMTHTASSQNSSTITVLGGGKSMIVGGDGGMMQNDPDLPTPVMTLFAFQASKNGDNVTGDFECLALAPRKAASFKPTSGSFSVNVMYVTGKVSELEIDGNKAVLKGKAIVTGLGAGTDLDFTLEIEEGGPGSLMTLTTANPEPGKSPLVFKELVTEGEVKFKL